MSKIIESLNKQALEAYNKKDLKTAQEKYEELIKNNQMFRKTIAI